MTTPEPLDEQAPAPAETRGGNSFSDIVAPALSDLAAEDLDWYPADEDE